MIPALKLIAAADAGSSMLTPDKTLLIVLVLFIIFVPILNRLLFQPLLAVLAERERLTDGSSTNARAMVLTVDQKLAEYEEGIRDARGEGYRAVEAKRTAAAEDRQLKIDAAREQSARKIAAAREQLNKDASAARESLGAEFDRVASEISSALLGRTVGGSR
ncbi:MAG: ATP synthase F0 subunit B [Acidobacteria bacterium]|nr:ATP synthase F0 subunit B [Acidobacteriota bacterium]